MSCAILIPKSSYYTIVDGRRGGAGGGGGGGGKACTKGSFFLFKGTGGKWQSCSPQDYLNYWRMIVVTTVVVVVVVVLCVLSGCMNMVVLLSTVHYSLANLRVHSDSTVDDVTKLGGRRYVEALI